MKIDATNIDPEMMGRMPVSKGTQLPVKYLFQWLKTETLQDF